jgi:hypothetical protein
MVLIACCLVCCWFVYLAVFVAAVVIAVVAVAAVAAGGRHLFLLSFVSMGCLFVDVVVGLLVYLLLLMLE